jgi:hypothetical protein
MITRRLNSDVRILPPKNTIYLSLLKNILQARTQYFCPCGHVGHNNKEKIFAVKEF